MRKSDSFTFHKHFQNEWVNHVHHDSGCENICWYLVGSTLGVVFMKCMVVMFLFFIAGFGHF